MSSILYYSNHCPNCSEMLSKLAKNCTKEIHFICIDRRRNDTDGSTYVIMENREILLPPNITSVPSLILMTDGYRILTGKTEILERLRPTEATNYKTSIRANPSDDSKPPTPPTPPTDPISFGQWDTTGIHGVSSDAYSYLDQSPDSMLAKGDGGVRQMYNYSGVCDVDNTIETPPDTYTPDKVGDGDMDKLQQERIKSS